MVSDSLCTVLGQRPNERLRFWLEDSFGRLTRNGWANGTTFAPIDRPGVGMIFARATEGPYVVSQRRGRSVFSFESRRLMSALQVPDVRVRVSVNQISLHPRLRVFSIQTQRNGTWFIEGERVISPEGSTYSLDSAKPLTIGRTASVIQARLTEGNLVVATELLGNVLAPRVELSGDPLLIRIASQFLRDGDYTEAAPGVMVR